MAEALPEGRSAPWAVPWTWGEIVVGVVPLSLIWCVAHLAPWTAVRIGAWLGAFVWMVLFPWLARRRHRARSGGGARRSVDRMGGVFGVAAGLLMLLVVALAMRLIAEPTMSSSGDPIDDAPRSWFWPLLVLGCTLGPLAEELYFRGFLFHALARRWPTALAVVVQAVLFALPHGYPPLGAVMVGLIGVALALLVRWRGSLVVAVSAHITVNALLFGALAEQRAHEPAWAGLGVRDDAQPFVVTQVAPGSPAEDAGLVMGDRLVTVDGYALPESFRDLRHYIGSRSPGDVLVLVVERAGRELELRLVLRSRPPPTPPPD